MSAPGTVKAPWSAAQVRAELERLDNGVPWAHHFELAGVETISQERDAKFYKKAMGLKPMEAYALSFCRTFTDSRNMSESRILDVACGEGGLSIAFAQAGAREVVGVDGRDIYVDRARLVADALALSNVSFEQQDVRRLSAEEFGGFDFVICSGILHHLGRDDFLPFLQSMAELTTDTLMLYTHVATPAAVKNFRLEGPVEAEPGFLGWLFREHADNATPEQKAQQVRASLDNTFSFWATEETLTRALKRVGFAMVMKSFEPHVFESFENKNLRVLYLAKKQRP